MCDEKQVAAYSKAVEAAKEKLQNWDDFWVPHFKRFGFTDREIARGKKQIELNAKGIFR